MSTAIVGVIVRTRELLRVRSRSLTVRSPSAFARHVIDVCGLTDLLDPGPEDATGITNAATALGTWVSVPATDRVDGPAEPSAPAPNPAPEHVRVGTVAARMGNLS